MDWGGEGYGRARWGAVRDVALPAKQVEGSYRRMKSEAVRIPVITGLRAARVLAFVGTVADGRSQQRQPLLLVRLQCRFGLTHLSGSDCTGASGNLPLSRHQTRAFAAAHPRP